MRTPFFAARRHTLRAISLAAALGAPILFHAPQAAAQAYPDRPVKIVVGFAPGGTNDIVARLVAQKLGDRLKQSFIVDNKPGANSALGNDLVAKSKPDGYTLLVSSSGGLTTNPILMKNLAYDPEKDFEPIALLGTFPLVVTVNPSLPVKKGRSTSSGRSLPSRRGGSAFTWNGGTKVRPLPPRRNPAPVSDRGSCA